MGFYYAEDSFLNVCSFEDSITSLSFTRQLEHSGSLMVRMPSPTYRLSLSRTHARMHAQLL